MDPLGRQRSGLSRRSQVCSNASTPTCDQREAHPDLNRPAGEPWAVPIQVMDALPLTPRISAVSMAPTSGGIKGDRQKSVKLLGGDGFVCYISRQEIQMGQARRTCYEPLVSTHPDTQGRRC